ncbi:MAG: chorismate lyase [Gammaproteobacteria bacterium]|nr:MAG: chorismate lyase [Gammaproteobacteria bacterium]
MSLKPLPTTPAALFARLHGQGGGDDDLRLLRCEGSMTRALARRFGPVRVERSSEGLVVPRPDEARLLDRRQRGGFWCREIKLLAGGRVRLEGRTLAPPDAVRLQRDLRRLGDRPLMDLLFRHDRLRPDVQRELRRFGRDRRGSLVRVTLFRIRREPLLLLESLCGL